MSATITVSVRIPLKQAKLIKRAARAQGVKLATFVREQAYIRATMYLQPASIADLTTDTAHA